MNITLLPDSKIRTLSANFFGASPDDDSGELHTITSGNENQWNTVYDSMYAAYDGFDFQECNLKDIPPFRVNVTQTSNTSQYENIWLPTRSRLQLHIQSTSETNTRLHYQISENASATSEEKEITGKVNTLMICPRDEGIGNNAPMTISIWRTKWNGKQQIYHSEKLVLYCHTYGEPEIHITNPQKNRAHVEGSVDHSDNYALIATEVINKSEDDSVDDTIFICPVLSLMTSQDALDDSGMESFTRVCVKEYLGYIEGSAAWNDYTGYNGDTRTPADSAGKVSNKAILENTSEARCTGVWTGVFKDSDGSVVNLSGVANMSGSDKDERLLWSVPGGVPSSIADLQDHIYGGSPDLRMCFRAGYKYLITVRRFHGYAAGYANINSAGYPQYGYDERTGSDYPPHPDSRNSAGRVYLTAPNGTGRIAGYAGPPINYDVNGNNAASKFTATGETNNSFIERWVGPYAGETIETEVEPLFPGFSQSDYIILDCVRNQTSSKNMITVRPASQEISADHWITFGYRHLARAQRGTDGTWTKPVDAVRDSDGGLTYDSSGRVQFFNRIGMMINDPVKGNYSESKPNESKLYDSTGKDLGTTKNWGMNNSFSNTWEGTDTTRRRIGKMYTALVSRALRQFLKSSVYEQYVNDVYEASKCPGDVDDEGEVTYRYGTSKSSIKPKLKIEIPRIDYWGRTLVWDTVYETESFPTFGGSENDAYDGKNTKSFLGYYTYVTGHSGHKPTSNPGEFSANNQIVFNENPASDASQYGNEYTWVPIINAQAGAQWLPVSTTAKGSQIHNPNKIVTDSEFFTDNMFTANYVEEGNPNWGGCEYNKFLKVDRNHTFNITDGAYTTSTAGAFDGSVTPPASSYSVVWEGNIPTEEETPKAKNNRHYSITNGGNDNGYGGRQYFTGGGTDSAPISDQRTAGKLYLRVPPKQDCENGTAESWTPREIANRFDIAMPTVRTTHLGYYKTYICGDMRITLDCSYTKSDHEYDDEGNVSHVTETETYPTKIFKLDDISVKGDNWGKNIGFHSGAIRIASSYDNDGKPQSFTTIEYAYQSETPTTSFPHMLTVFGEDNNGLGRCLSANDFTSVYHYYANNERKFYFINELEPAKATGGNGGGIEVPVRVRYTPIAQPELTDYMYSTPTRTSKNSNVIKVCSCYTSCSNRTRIHKEYGSDNVDSGMKCQPKFSVDIAYGLFNDKCRGIYKTKQNTDWYNRQYRLLVGAVGDAVPNTDFYPAVGICNAFMVVLFPNGATNSSGKTLSYHDQAPNFWSKRSNFETSYSRNGARPVIVADVAATDIYKTFNTGGGSDRKINNQLSTAFRCEFNYTDLIAGDKVISAISSKSTRNSLCKLEQNVWYDLVVVPIYTSNSSIDNTRRYVDGNGTINGKAFGGGSASSEVVYYYGSNPLVVRNFLNIASVDNYNGIIDSKGNKRSCGSGGGGGYTPSYSTVDPPFSTEGCILYPNVNHFKFNPSNGSIKDCPGFWLNNTFRVVIRAPHFRTRSQISADSRYGGRYNYEQPLETASNGQIENPEDFEFSDVMIHFGKYTDYVRVRDAETGEWEYDEDSNGNKMRFNSSEFQDLVTRNALDKEWLNARNIYTIRTNPEAWSKRVPEVKDDANNIRDTIKAGSLTSEGSKYADRMVVFNPNIVNAYTYDAEGYYMQVRFLNAVYAGTSQKGTWSSWCGGIMDDDAQFDTEQDMHLKGKSGLTWKKDQNLEYYVPVRSYTDIFTTARHYIKGSVPGSYLTTPNNSAKFTANYIKAYEDADSFVKGEGGHSPLHDENATAINARNHADNYSVVTHRSVISDKYFTVPEYEGIQSIHLAGENDTQYQPWPADHDYTEYFGYLRDPNTDSSDFKPSQEAVERYAAFHEMYYLDYIIRNMAKLYHSNWSEQCCEDEDMNAKDIGWTLAKELITGYTEWSNEVSDATSAARKAKADVSRAVTDKFFKQSIKVEDFDSLLVALKKLVDFTRNTKWSGTHTSKTDTINSQGEHTGLTVLPIDSSRLSLDKCTDESVGGGRRMLIGADIDRPTEDNHGSHNENDWNYKWRSFEGNYIDRLWKMLTELVIQDSDPTQAQ